MTITLLRSTFHRRLSAALVTSVLFGLVSVPTYAAQPITNYEYDANGNLTKITDGLGHATTQQYDALNRLIQQNQPHPTGSGQLGTIKTQYNALDQVTGVTDPRALATSYSKNAFGEPLTQVSPDTGSTTNTYDIAGNLKTRTDAAGRVATYSYDALNRLTGLTYKPSATGAVDETITYSYDQGTNGKGHLTGMTDLSGSTSWSYDLNGRLIRKQQVVGSQLFDLQLQYDSAGRVSRIIYPSTRYVDYTYNTNGQISQVSVDGQVMVGNIQYFATGIPKSWTWGNNQAYSRALDNDGRLAQFTIGGLQMVNTYDAAGRITQQHRAAVATPNTPSSGTTSTYAYDNLDRLTNNVAASVNESFQYDLNGNRTQLTIGANNYAYGIASTSNRLASEAGPTARTYSYDSTGNITGNGQDTYSYYSSGRLKQVTRTSTSTNIYSLVYNGLGQFVHRSNDNNRYLYDQAGHLLGEYDALGNISQETVWLGDTPVLTLRPNSQQRTADNTDTDAAKNAVFTGTWTAGTVLKGYYGTNYHSHAAAASTTDKVVYTITPSATQSFRVYARWTAAAGNASNASYTINTNVSGSTPSTVTANQQQNGGTWNYLGSYTLNSANNLTVTLSGQGNGIVQADAIRIVPNTAASIQTITNFIHADHLNTPRVIRNYANQGVWWWIPEGGSEVFGNGLPNENPSSLGIFQYNLRFPGQMYNAASGLTYNYYRDYNPRTGRYIESDPIGLAGGINTYGYVGGNPVSYVDTEGLTPGTAVGASIGTFILPGPGTVAGAVIGTAIGVGIAVAVDNAMQSRASGEEKLPIVNPGKDCNGNCKPCPPGKRWFVPKPGHGHENGYWHSIVYNQDKKTCICYPDRPSGGLEGF